MNLEICTVLLSAALPFINVQQTSAKKTRFKQIVAFGDSITDDGFSVTGDKHGFERLCAGPNWPEYLQMLIGADEIDNYAYAGALSDYKNYFKYDWSGGLWQIEKYIEESSPSKGENYDEDETDKNQKDESETLFAFQSLGINDFFYGIDFALPSYNASYVAANFYTALSKLASNGARHILAFNIIDKKLDPIITDSPEPAYRQQIDSFTNKVNSLIATKVEILTTEYPQTNLYLVNIEPLITDAKASGELKMEIFDHHEAGIKPGDKFKYAFFDGSHPSTVLHYQIAQKAAEAL